MIPVVKENTGLKLPIMLGKEITDIPPLVEKCISQLSFLSYC